MCTQACTTWSPHALLPSQNWLDAFAQDASVCEHARTRCIYNGQSLTCSKIAESRRRVYVGECPDPDQPDALLEGCLLQPLIGLTAFRITSCLRFYMYLST